MKIVNKNFSVLFFFSLKVKNENTRVLLGTRVSKKNSYSELGFKKKTRTFANPTEKYQNGENLTKFKVKTGQSKSSLVF